MQQDQKQWLRVQIMIQLLKDLNKEFKRQTYDLNTVTRSVVDHFRSELQIGEMHKQALDFSQLLGGTPRYFVQLLDQEIISSQTHIITLNSRNWEVARRIFSDFAVITKVPSPERTHDDPFLHDALIVFINTVSKRVAALYQRIAANIKQRMQKLIKTVRQSRMMNNFLLFKILREVSESIKAQTIQICTETVFRYCQLETIEQFYKYIMNKFQMVKLFANVDAKDSIPQMSPLGLLNSLQKNTRIQILMKEAVSQDGLYSIFLNPQSSHPELQKSLDDYLLLLGDEGSLKLINCKTIRKNWFVIGDLKNNFKFEKMAKDYLVEGQFKVDCKKKQNIQIGGTPLENFTNLDGVIGRCLYHMKKYNKAFDFFQDLSKRAILSKSIEEIMHTFPLVGFLMAAGSFTKAFYRVFSNRFSTDSKKITEITGFVVKTGATIGSSIVGAFLGQALIPIPVVGALVGTVVGGLLGERGCRQVTSIIESVHFQHIIHYLKLNIKNNCYWTPTDQFYDLIDVKQKQFQRYIPKHMKFDSFITIVGFVLVCFHESTRLAKHNEERAKRDEEEELKKKKGKKVAESAYQREKDFEDEVQKLGESDGFQTEFDLMAITEYLQNNNALIYEHYQVLQKSILTFISKILPS